MSKGSFFWQLDNDAVISALSSGLASRTCDPQSHTGLHTQKGSVLGLGLCYLESLDNFVSVFELVFSK